MQIVYKQGHNSSLDGIRGLAVLLVIFFHCFENRLPGALRPLSDIGWIGVDLFFVLSGFLITGILVDTKGQDRYLKNFFAKRALRIFPLYYMVLILFFGALQVPYLTDHHPALSREHLKAAGYYFTFTQNLYFAYNGWGVTDVLNHFWSLAVEEQFYMFWPFIVYFSNRSQLLAICGILVATSLIVRNTHADSDFSYVFTLARVDALAIGATVAILIRERAAMLSRMVGPVFFIAFGIVLYICISTGYLHFRNEWFMRAGYTLLALGFGSMIAMVFDKTRAGTTVNAVFSLSFLQFFGKYSYGIYIYHWLLYKVFYQYYENKYGLSGWYLIPFLLAVIGVSVCSYQFFEKYFLAFKTRFNTVNVQKPPTDGKPAPYITR